MTDLSRRRALGLLMAGSLTGAALPRPAFAQGVEGRTLIFVILRGAMDGLAALIPDDREIDTLRGSILPEPATRLDLGNGFRLHPALSALKDLYQAGEAGFVHASATAYRDRSHFDGQDRLETLAPPGTRDGWLNRATGALGGQALAVGYALPLALKGPAPARNWAPAVFEPASEDLAMRLQDLYAGDPLLAEALATARAMPAPETDLAGQGGPRGIPYAATLQAMGDLMAAPDAPGIGMVSLEGWDTHANQAPALQARFTQLGLGLSRLKTALGPKWATTCVVMCSEFGRTAAANGTRGTDHGIGGLTVLAGGAVAGRQVHGDWPGLSPRDLYEGRDLAPANAVEAVLKGVLRDHLGLPRAVLDSELLPGSPRALDGLIAA